MNREHLVGVHRGHPTNVAASNRGIDLPRVGVNLKKLGIQAENLCD